jgi:putative membrane protein
MVSFLTAWDWEPTVLVGLVLAIEAYAIGWARLQRQERLAHRRRHRRTATMAPPPTWRIWCYAGGIAALVLALLSPISTFDSASFFVHMIQHLLLALVAPPLLWLGAPLLPFLWTLPRSGRRAIGSLFVAGHPVQRLFHVLTEPRIAAGLAVSALVFWHMPTFYDAAQGATVTHDLEHVIFFGTGLLYWWPVVHPSGGRRRLGYGWAIFYLLPPVGVMIALGALLSLTGAPIYATYQRGTPLWGLTVVQDQEIGGLIMWIPGGWVYLVALLICLGKFLEEEERRARRTLRPGPRRMSENVSRSLIPTEV